LSLKFTVLLLSAHRNNADLGARVERHRNVVEDDLVAVCFARFGHGVNELSHEAQAIRP